MESSLRRVSFVPLLFLVNDETGDETGDETEREGNSPASLVLRIDERISSTETRTTLNLPSKDFEVAGGGRRGDDLTTLLSSSSSPLSVSLPFPLPREDRTISKCDRDGRD